MFDVTGPAAGICECGKQVTTCFCPDCGRAASGTANSLLTHILKVARATKTRHETLDRQRANGKPIDAHHLATLADRVKLWNSWADWVRSAQATEAETKEA